MGVGAEKNSTNPSSNGVGQQSVQFPFKSMLLTHSLVGTFPLTSKPFSLDCWAISSFGKLKSQRRSVFILY
jgi:hypothetical protein